MVLAPNNPAQLHDHHYKFIHLQLDCICTFSSVAQRVVWSKRGRTEPRDVGDDTVCTKKNTEKEREGDRRKIEIYWKIARDKTKQKTEAEWIYRPDISVQTRPNHPRFHNFGRGKNNLNFDIYKQHEYTKQIEARMAK